MPTPGAAVLGVAAPDGSAGGVAGSGRSAPGAERHERLAQEVLSARRYQWLAPELVSRIAAAEAPKEARDQEAVKRIKRRLHQVCGAFVETLDVDRALARLTGAAQDSDETHLRQACRELLGFHASTRERLPFLDHFYQAIFAITGPPSSVLDVACGLAPLAVPWMGLAPGTRYVALDIDRRLIDVVRGALALFSVDGCAAQCDVANLSAQPAGVALLLKAAPTLEQQSPGAATRLLRDLNAPWLVVSFPTRSLGGGGKGREGHYRQELVRLLPDSQWRVTELAFPNELVFVVKKGAPHTEPA